MTKYKLEYIWLDGYTPVPNLRGKTQIKEYDAFPTLSPNEAADLVMKAVIEKPKRVATGLGLIGAIAQAVTPNISEFVLNQAYRLFPDSAAARGLSEEEAAAEQDRLPRSPVDLARKLFSQVFNGVHW